MDINDKLEELRSKNNQIIDKAKEANDFGEISSGYKRAAEIAGSANIILSDIDKQFKDVTKLNNRDMSFLITAVALQCVRQYVINVLTNRVNHSESDEIPHKIQEFIWKSDNSPSKIKEYREAGARYRATREEIMNSFSVPYDVISGSKQFGVGGNNQGLSGVTHRNKTLGHDPYFGWFFGTANIMTNTLTNDLCQTFHVKNSKVVSYGGYDKTIKMVNHFKERSKSEPSDLGICLIKQGLHIASDTYSKEGIPFLMSNLNMDGASKLTKYGLKVQSGIGLEEFSKKISNIGIEFGDFFKIIPDATLAALINQVIAMLHRGGFDESIDGNESLFEVRTRKILLISNTISSTSNVLFNGIIAGTSFASGNTKGVKDSLRNLDIGGLIIAIGRILRDSNCISKIKEEYLAESWYEYVQNELH